MLREKIPALHFSLLSVIYTTHLSILTLWACWLYLCMQNDAWHALALFCDYRSDRHPVHIDTEASISGCLLSQSPPEAILLLYLVLWLGLMLLHFHLTTAARACVLKNEDSSTTFAFDHFWEQSFGRLMLIIIFHLRMVNVFTNCLCLLDGFRTVLIATTKGNCFESALEERTDIFFAILLVLYSDGGLRKTSLTRALRLFAALCPLLRLSELVTPLLHQSAVVLVD